MQKSQIKKGALIAEVHGKTVSTTIRDILPDGIKLEINWQGQTTGKYTAGHTEKPTYEQVCTDKTGHAEAIEVVYDAAKTNYENLAKLFFEIHDPTQTNGQGPDIGEQYKSAVFYTDDEQKQITENLIQILKDKGYKVITQVCEAKTFWIAENYHQDYYSKTGKKPYCHFYTKRF